MVMIMRQTERPRKIFRWNWTSLGISMPKSMKATMQTSEITTALKKVNTPGRVPGSSRLITPARAAGSSTSSDDMLTFTMAAKLTPN